jgi:ArsR family transcriptional regulator
MATNGLVETVSLANFIQIIGQQARIQILLVIARQEACVCHIEAALNLRQAAISQHLMVLRDAGLVSAQREGRNIFYRLTRPELIDIIHQVAALAGLDIESLAAISHKPVPGCTCPHCNPSLDPELTCVKSKAVRA